MFFELSIYNGTAFVPYVRSLARLFKKKKQLDNTLTKAIFTEIINMTSNRSFNSQDKTTHKTWTWEFYPQRRLQMHLHTLTELSIKWKININADKSKALRILSGRRSKRPEGTVVLDVSRIPCTASKHRRVPLSRSKTTTTHRQKKQTRFAASKWALSK